VSARTLLWLNPRKTYFHSASGLGRYLLQVDRQTKGSYQNSEAADEAGRAIKTGYPILQVVVYDAVECLGKPVELPKI